MPGDKSNCVTGAPSKTCSNSFEVSDTKDFTSLLYIASVACLAFNRPSSVNYKYYKLSSEMFISSIVKQ